MPSRGHGTCHYYFKLLGLDAEMDLKPGVLEKSSGRRFCGVGLWRKTPDGRAGAATFWHGRLGQMVRRLTRWLLDGRICQIGEPRDRKASCWADEAGPDFATSCGDRQSARRSVAVSDPVFIGFSSTQPRGKRVSRWPRISGDAMKRPALEKPEQRGSPQNLESGCPLAPPLTALRHFASLLLEFVDKVPSLFFW